MNLALGFALLFLGLLGIALSAHFKGLRWQASLVLGILLCLAGNVAVLWGKGASRR